MSLCLRCREIPFYKAFLPPDSPDSYSRASHDFRLALVQEIRCSAGICDLCSSICRFLAPDTDLQETLWIRIDSIGATVWTGNDAPQQREARSEAGSIKILAERGNPLEWISDWSKVEKDPLMPNAFARIENWLKVCNQTHVECLPLTEPQPLPRRLVDVGKVEGIPDISGQEFSPQFLETLINLKSTNGETGRYVILSYCWGLSQPVTTQSSTLESRESGFQVKILPKTIQDAVYLTRKFGLRYLWVDALCIVQDSKDEWAEEALKMGDYYSHAYLTIAASAAADSSQGCFKERVTRDYISFDAQSSDDAPMRIHLYVTPMPAAPGSVEAVYHEATWV